MSTQYTAQTFSLAQDINAGTTYLTIDFTFTYTPLFTGGKIKINKGEQSEWWVISGMALVAGETTLYRATVVSRGLKKNATSETDTDTALQKDHNTTTECKFVTHSLDWNAKAFESGDNTFSGDNTVTGTLSFTGTTEAGLKLQQVTTTQRDALTGTGSGSAIYNTTTSAAQVKDPWGNWDSLPTGDTNPNASETVAGKVKLATVVNQQDAALDTNVVQTRYLKSTPSVPQTSDYGKIAITDSTGKVNYQFISSRGRMFGGTGADGAVGAGALNLGVFTNTYLVKNYTSFAPGAFTVSATGQNGIVHVKVLGDCDLTGTTIDFSANGTVGGAGGFVNDQSGGNGASGTASPMTVYSYIPTRTAATAGGGGASGTGGTAGTGGSVWAPNETLFIATHTLMIAPGEGGGGGGGGYTTTTGGSGNTYSGGQGGNGGGCIIFEVGGNLTFSGTTVNVSGQNGSVGSAGTGTSRQGSGGGGGGGGGSALFIYNGTLSGSPTSVVTGGTGGAGGATASGGAPERSGGGGAGGSSLWNAGTSGTNGGSVSPGGTGGNGGDGKVILIQNTIFS